MHPRIPLTPRRVTAAALLVAALTACSPPGFIQRMVANPRPHSTAPVLPPPPLAPPEPSAFMFGVVVTTNSAGWAELVERDPQPGALVVDVIPGSPAEANGMARGDLIVSIDSQPITNNEGVTVEFRRSAEPEHEIERVRPDGSQETLSVTLAPAGDFALGPYLKERAAGDPSPVNRFLVAQNASTPTEALSLIDPLLKEAPRFAPGYALKARRLLDGAVQKIQEGRSIVADTAAMREAVQRAKEFDSKSAEIRVTAARILMALDEGTSAETEATQAVSLDGNSAESNYILGAARFELRKYDSALDPLLRAVELNPYEVEYYAVLARCYLSLGAAASARTTVDVAKGVTADPALREGLESLLGPASPRPPTQPAGRRI